MGEVYEATDTKLNRDVALKVLPEEFAKDHDRMARFKCEAQVLASLNHPNIAAMYGLEEDGGKQVLALERAEEGIRVNAAAPAVVEIPIYGSFVKPETIAKELKEFNEFHPIGRIGQPIDVASAMLFLLSDKASWVSRAAGNADGGVLAGRNQ